MYDLMKKRVAIYHTQPESGAHEDDEVGVYVW